MPFPDMCVRRRYGIIGVRSRSLGWSEMTFCYFPTSVGGIYFGKCKQRSIGCGRSSGSQTSVTSWYFLFRSRFYFRFYLSFRGATLIPRPSCARDLVNMAEVGSGRAVSLRRVTTASDRFPGALRRNSTRWVCPRDLPGWVYRYP